MDQQEEAPKMEEEDKMIEEEPEVEAKTHKKVLVLDANVFLRQKTFEDIMGNEEKQEDWEIVTTRDVLNEVKDSKSRDFVERIRTLEMPFKLSIRDPTEKSMDFVCNFSKKTGDFHSLSGTDLRVMALGYRYILRRDEQGSCL